MRLSPGALLFAGIPCGPFLGCEYELQQFLLYEIACHDHVCLNVNWLVLTLNPPSKLGVAVIKWSFAVPDHPR